MTSRAIHWADLPAPYGRRPVCVLTRPAALPVLTGITVAPITTAVRGIDSEVIVGQTEGLRTESAISCDNLITITRRLIDPDPIGRLDTIKSRQLDRALRYALAIR